MDFIKNKYQLDQLIQFFNKLQTLKPSIKVITNQSFQSSVSFPVIKVRKEYEVWIMKVTILQELYSFEYKFFLPEYFLIYRKYF